MLGLPGSLTEIRQVCLYLTRMCNLDCTYCKIRKPISNDLNTTEMLRVIDLIHERIKPEFLVLFGGEPFLRKDIYDIIAHLNEIGQNYTVISNSTIPVDFKRVPFKSYTGSIDWRDIPTDHVGSIERKAQAALTRLIEAKAAGVPDVTGNIIITSKNVSQVPSLVRWLSTQGIWSIVGLVHSGKEGFWKFRSDCPDLLTSHNDAQILAAKLMEMKREGLLIHNCDEYFILLPHFTGLTWKCSNHNLRYLIVDSDGTLMSCNDIDCGVMKRFSIFDLPGAWESVKLAWNCEIQDCPGCYYNHMIQVHFGGRLLHE